MRWFRGIVFYFFVLGAEDFGMTTVSILHYGAYRIDDLVDAVTSTQPVTLAGARTIQADGTGLVSATSTTGFSQNRLTLNVSITSEEPWVFDNGVEARIDYVFIPESPLVDISFTGISGDHSFESGSFYTLSDLDTTTSIGPLVLDERSWEYEDGFGFVDDVLPRQSLFELVPDHQYKLTVGAYGMLGDMRQGFAELECSVTPVTVVPVPGAVSLAVMGAGLLCAAKRCRKKAAA